MVTEIFGRGNVLVGKCPVVEVSVGEVSCRRMIWYMNDPFGEMSIGEVSVRDLSLGKWRRGSTQSGKCLFTIYLVLTWE